LLPLHADRQLEPALVPGWWVQDMLPPVTRRSSFDHAESSSSRASGQSAFPPPRPTLPAAGRLGYKAYSEEGGFVAWANDPSVLQSGQKVTPPGPKRYPKREKAAPQLRKERGAVFPARSKSPVAATTPEAGVEDAAAPIAEKELWPGPLEFANSKVYNQWRRVLDEGQKLQDKCRAWDKATVYPVWRVPKERAGQPPRRDEVKGRRAQATQLRLTKEGAIREKQRLAQEAKRRKAAAELSEDGEPQRS